MIAVKIVLVTTVLLALAEAAPTTKKTASPWDFVNPEQGGLVVSSGRDFGRAKANPMMSKFKSGPTLPWYNVVVRGSDSYPTTNSQQERVLGVSYYIWGILLFISYKVMALIGMILQRHSSNIEKAAFHEMNVRCRPLYKQPIFLTGFAITVLAPPAFMLPALLYSPLWQLMPFAGVTIAMAPFFAWAIAGEPIGVYELLIAGTLGGMGCLAAVGANDGRHATALYVDNSHKATGSAAPAGPAPAGALGLSSELRVLYNSAEFWGILVTGVLLVIVFIVYKRSLRQYMRAVSNNWSLRYAFSHFLSTASLLCGILGGLNAVFLHAAYSFWATLWSEKDGATGDKIEAVLSSGLAWWLGIVAFVTYIMYYWTMASALFDIQARHFTVEEQFVEMTTNTFSWFIIFLWYRHTSTLWCGLSVGSMILGQAILLIYSHIAAKDYEAPLPRKVYYDEATAICIPENQCGPDCNQEQCEPPPFPPQNEKSKDAEDRPRRKRGPCCN